MITLDRFKVPVRAVNSENSLFLLQTYFVSPANRFVLKVDLVGMVFDSVTLEFWSNLFFNLTDVLRWCPRLFTGPV